MAARSKSYRFFSWPSFAVHLLLIVAVGLLLTYARPDLLFTHALLYAFAVYFAWSTLARATVLPTHGRAMRMMRRGDYPGAIAAFEQSERYLAANPWIDQYRWIALLSASAISYREMALFNIAKAHTYLDHAGPARKAFNRFLEVAPRSPLAPTVRVILGTLGGKK